MGSLLCETVTAPTMADLLRARDAVCTADMVELRLDGVADIDVPRALAGRRLPAVVTCRPAWEGGQFVGPDGDRSALLLSALEHGAEYVDVEWRALRAAHGAGFQRLLDAHADRVILSAHDFDRVPVDLVERAWTMRRTGAAVIKIAITAAKLSDTLTLLDIAGPGDAVVIGMGEPGLPTRLLASRFGSRWTYGGNAVAPGQIPSKVMVEQYRFREIGPQTAIYGHVGKNAAASDAPARQNAAFAAEGRDAVCVPMPTDDKADYEAFADAIGLAGATWETDID